MHDKDSEIFLSIILPTYNVGKYIDRALASCCSQSYENIEIIIVDDCGSDDSIEKAVYWTRKDHRIRIVRNTKNLGTYHARRVGTELARGQYTLYLDPDDELSLNATAVIFKETKINKPDIVLFDVKQVPKTRQLFRKSKSFTNQYEEGRIDRKILNKRGIAFGTPGKAYRTSLAKNIYKINAVPQEHRLVFAEDVLIFFGAIIQAKNFSSIARKLYVYHRNEESVTRGIAPEKIRAKCEQIDLVVKLVKNVSETSHFYLQSKVVENVVYNITKKLISDKYLIGRYELHPISKRKVYVYNVWKSFAHRKSPADILRLVIYLFSFGLVRI
jgi:glycosyltransferase involved in cell wall biosynthesis